MNKELHYRKTIELLQKRIDDLEKKLAVLEEKTVRTRACEIDERTTGDELPRFEQGGKRYKWTGTRQGERIRQLEGRLNEILASKSWRLALFLRRISGLDFLVRKKNAFLAGKQRR